MAQQANLTLELDKVKDLLLCQGDTGVAQLLNAVLDQILKAEATEQIGAESYYWKSSWGSLSLRRTEVINDPLSVRWTDKASQNVWRLDQIFSFPQITIFSNNEVSIANSDV